VAETSRQEARGALEIAFAPHHCKINPAAALQAIAFRDHLLAGRNSRV
jgi:hypothetical protein